MADSAKRQSIIAMLAKLSGPAARALLRKHGIKAHEAGLPSRKRPPSTPRITNQEEKVAWVKEVKRRRQKREAQIWDAHIEHTKDWRKIHGEGDQSPPHPKAFGTRLDINDYGSAPSSINNVGVIKRRRG